jgi:hypothetical protein
LCNLRCEKDDSNENKYWAECVDNKWYEIDIIVEDDNFCRNIIAHKIVQFLAQVKNDNDKCKQADCCKKSG